MKPKPDIKIHTLSEGMYDVDFISLKDQEKSKAQGTLVVEYICAQKKKFLSLKDKKTKENYVLSEEEFFKKFFISNILKRDGKPPKIKIPCSSQNVKNFEAEETDSRTYWKVFALELEKINEQLVKTNDNLKNQCKLLTEMHERAIAKISEIYCQNRVKEIENTSNLAKLHNESRKIQIELLMKQSFE